MLKLLERFRPELLGFISAIFIARFMETGDTFYLKWLIIMVFLALFDWACEVVTRK